MTYSTSKTANGNFKTLRNGLQIDISTTLDEAISLILDLVQATTSLNDCYIEKIPGAFKVITY